jgi:two-component system chemotaxis response regulator CheY
MALDFSMPVLVADDYRTMVRIIHNLLRQIGFCDLDGAANGIMAMEKLHSRRYGLVIADWNMEPMTGYDLLQAIRADPALAGTPFIMITAESKSANIVAAKQAGVSDYIVKPFNARLLESKIESIFAEKKTTTGPLPVT